MHAPIEGVYRAKLAAELALGKKLVTRFLVLTKTKQPIVDEQVREVEPEKLTRTGCPALGSQRCPSLRRRPGKSTRMKRILWAGRTRTRMGYHVPLECRTSEPASATLPPTDVLSPSW